MTRLDKLIDKFKTSPNKLSLRDIEQILMSIGFDKLNAKGSHVKYIQDKFGLSIVIPIHNNDCKDFYKKLVLRIIKDLI